jgi:NitT/TauT family transport system permease protein
MASTADTANPASGVPPTELDDQLAGLDALELGETPRGEVLGRVWGAVWPKAAAVALFFGIWQVVVWSGWKPTYVLPPPGPVLERLWVGISDGSMIEGAALTLRRALVGYAIALVIGVVVGMAVARSRILRSAVGSMITGLQTMPSIVWFPLAILLFQLTESAILFVVVLGAAPAIANGLIAGADNVPPILVRAGRVLGARGLGLWRHVILPASLPMFVTGMKQGWAFAWRSLLAGELLVIIAGVLSLGVQLQNARDLLDPEWLLATMMVIFFIGVVVDALGFGTLERWIRRRYGLTQEH